MCGIVGCNYNPNINFNDIIKLLDKRGPDCYNIKQINNNFFGHTRLTILDFNKDSNQPMIFDNILIVFNGQIYNHKQLKIKENLKTITKSDTEIIIRLYQKYKYEFLNRLNGMFSFCIYDIKEDIYFCARDKYGKKPFYYYFDNNKFIFSSMIKPILKILNKTPTINKIALSQYLQYFTPINNNTFFKNIYKLEAANYIIYDNKDFITKSYYKINTYKKIKNESLAITNIEEILINSIKYRINADVKIGSLLSGGIDSSLISSIYSKLSKEKIDTFSIGYNEYKKYDELKYAKITAKYINSNHHELIISKKDFINSFEDVQNALEEPHADSASIPLHLLTKYIKQSNIKSVLSGEGSDELFLGYNNYQKILKYYQFQKTLNKNQFEFMNSIINTIQNQTKESEYLRRTIKKEDIYNSFGEIFTSIQQRKLFKNIPKYKKIKSKKDPIDFMSYIDIKIWIGNVLLSKVDKISMNNSVEVRTPFLDYHLVDYLFSIDSNIKIGNTNKYLLKKIANKYLPKEIIYRTKKGFNSPYNEWIFEEWNSSILDLLLEVNNQTDFFNTKYIKEIFLLAKQNKFKQHLWSLFIFSKWFKKTYL